MVQKLPAGHKLTRLYSVLRVMLAYAVKVEDTLNTTEMSRKLAQKPGRDGVLILLQLNR